MLDMGVFQHRSHSFHPSVSVLVRRRLLDSPTARRTASQSAPPLALVSEPGKKIPTKGEEGNTKSAHDHLARELEPVEPSLLARGLDLLVEVV